MRIVARDQFAAPAGAAAGAGLQIVEIGAHAADLRCDLAALGRRRGAEEQELVVLAADRMRIGDGAIDLGALPFGRGLILRALPVARAFGDGLTQPLAIRALRERTIRARLYEADDEADGERQPLNIASQPRRRFEVNFRIRAGQSSIPRSADGTRVIA